MALRNVDIFANIFKEMYAICCYVSLHALLHAILYELASNKLYCKVSINTKFVLSYFFK